jgi:hypothetical protein
MWLKLYKSEKIVSFVDINYLNLVWWHKKWNERRNNDRHDVIVIAKDIANSIECIVNGWFAL